MCIRDRYRSVGKTLENDKGDRSKILCMPFSDDFAQTLRSFSTSSAYPPKPKQILTTFTRQTYRFSRSWSQRSRSGSDGHENLVNSIALELLKECDQKLTEILTVVAGQTD